MTNLQILSKAFYKKNFLQKKLFTKKFAKINNIFIEIL